MTIYSMESHLQYDLSLILLVFVVTISLVLFVSNDPCRIICYLLLVPITGGTLLTSENAELVISEIVSPERIKIAYSME
ncbi:MAG TPA: hypothetical protein VLD84_04445 [Nitrososphaeraceae archaeon]|nr:hypothetical protein [Nitrososphaeraceae archaeon]